MRGGRVAHIGNAGISRFALERKHGRGHAPTRGGQFSVAIGEPDYWCWIVGENAQHGRQIAGPVANEAIDRPHRVLWFGH